MKYSSGFIGFLLAAMNVIGTVAACGQNNRTPVTFSGEVALVSRYLWRGMEIGQSPSLQPGLCASWHDFTIGAWGAYKLNGPGMQETDFYLSKSFDFITISIWDYWNFTDMTETDFFNFNKFSTPHILEAQVLISGGQTIPLNFLVSYFFYGADPSKSIYLELQYVYQAGPVSLMAFAGYQPKGSYYAPTPAFVNIGCSLKRSIRITDQFELPLCLNLVFNPASRSAYLAAGLTITFDSEDE